MQRPTGEGKSDIDMSMVVSREEYESLIKRIYQIEKRNLE